MTPHWPLSVQMKKELKVSHVKSKLEMMKLSEEGMSEAEETEK